VIGGKLTRFREATYLFGVISEGLDLGEEIIGVGANSPPSVGLGLEG
jgi:hypothetical protein